MPYEVVNRMRQIQNVTIRGDNGLSATLTLMPRGKEGFKKQIPDSAKTSELELREKKGFIKLNQIEPETP